MRTAGLILFFPLVIPFTVIAPLTLIAAAFTWILGWKGERIEKGYPAESPAGVGS